MIWKMLATLILRVGDRNLRFITYSSQTLYTMNIVILERNQNNTDIMISFDVSKLLGPWDNL